MSRDQMPRETKHIQADVPIRVYRDAKRVKESHGLTWQEVLRQGWENLSDPATVDQEEHLTRASEHFPLTEQHRFWRCLVEHNIRDSTVQHWYRSYPKRGERDVTWYDVVERVERVPDPYIPHDLRDGTPDQVRGMSLKELTEEEMARVREYVDTHDITWEEFRDRIGDNPVLLFQIRTGDAPDPSDEDLRDSPGRLTKDELEQVAKYQEATGKSWGDIRELLVEEGGLPTYMEYF